MSKYELTAVIPTVQYGNVQPTLRGDELEPLQDEMNNLWLQYTGNGLKTHETGSPVASEASTIITCGASGVEYQRRNYHHYTNDGQRLYGAGTFTDLFKKEFPSDMIAGKIANKMVLGGKATKEAVEAMTPEQREQASALALRVQAMWNTKGEVSTSFGSSIHEGIELRGKYEQLAKDSGKPDNEAGRTGSPLIDGIVDNIFSLFTREATYEPFVAHPDSKLCGYIDRLAHVDVNKKIVRVQDYKTNLDIYRKQDIEGYFKGVVDNTALGAYWIQLSVYAYILEQHGYTVEGLDIFALDHKTLEWELISHDVLDIAQALETVELA